MNEDGYTHELIIKTDESILPHRNEGTSLEGGSLTACKNRGQVKHYSYEPHMQKVELKANLEKKTSTIPVRHPTIMHKTRRRVQIKIIRPMCLYLGHAKKLRNHKILFSKSENGQVR